MKLYVMSVFVTDQAQALDFYTTKLGFVMKHDIPLGTHRWLTVVERDNAAGIELLLEPAAHAAVGPFRQALKQDGIPAVSFQVDDVDAEFDRLSKLGVAFTQAPITAGMVKMAVLDDSCGNLVQLIQMLT